MLYSRLSTDGSHHSDSNVLDAIPVKSLDDEVDSEDTEDSIDLLNAIDDMNIREAFRVRLCNSITVVKHSSDVLSSQKYKYWYK